MRAIRSKGTSPERRFRALLVRYGFRGWHVNPTSIPGNPDFAFPTEKIAVFIDGCFWHGCPLCNRPMPETNRAYWRKKIARNVERDAEHNASLQALGWKVVRIWEHDLDSRADSGPLLSMIREKLGESHEGNA